MKLKENTLQPLKNQDCKMSQTFVERIYTGTDCTTIEKLSMRDNRLWAHVYMKY